MPSGKVFQSQLGRGLAQRGESAQHSEQALLRSPKEQMKVDQLQGLQIDRNIWEGQSRGTLLVDCRRRVFNQVYRLNANVMGTLLVDFSTLPGDRARWHAVSR